MLRFWSFSLCFLCCGLVCSFYFLSPLVICVTFHSCLCSSSLTWPLLTCPSSCMRVWVFPLVFGSLVHASVYTLFPASPMCLVYLFFGLPIYFFILPQLFMLPVCFCWIILDCDPDLLCLLSLHFGSRTPCLLVFLALNAILSWFQLVSVSAKALIPNPALTD